MIPALRRSLQHGLPSFGLERVERFGRRK